MLFFLGCNEYLNFLEFGSSMKLSTLTFDNFFLNEFIYLLNLSSYNLLLLIFSIKVLK